MKHLHIAVGGPLHGQVIEPDAARDNEYETLELHYRRPACENPNVHVCVYTHQHYHMHSDATILDAVLRSLA